MSAHNAGTPASAVLDPVLLERGQRLIEIRDANATDRITAKKTKQKRECINNLALGVWALDFDADLVPNYAAALGLRETNLEEYRAAALAWGDTAVDIAEGRAEPVAPWVVYREGTKDADRHAVLAWMVERGARIDYRSWRAACDKPDIDQKAPQNTTAERKAQQVRDLLTGKKDGDEVRAILASWEAKGKKEREAKARLAEIAREEERKRKEALRESNQARDERRSGKVQTPSVYFTNVMKELTGAAVLIASVLEQVEDIPSGALKRSIIHELREIQRHSTDTLRRLDPGVNIVPVDSRDVINV